jgi:hypothetical protein
MRMSGGTLSRRSRAVLAADGCLLTAGAFCLGQSLGFGIDSLAGGGPVGNGSTGGWATVIGSISWFISVVGVVIGPLAAWRLHGRRVGWTTTFGALVGYALGGASVFALTLVASLPMWAVRLVTGSEYAGAIAYLALVAAAFLVLSGWLAFDAARDLAPKRREHVWLDVVRLLATVSAVGFSAGVVAFQFRASGFDPEAVVFVLAAGVLGGAVVATADLAENYVRRQRTA